MLLCHLGDGKAAAREVGQRLRVCLLHTGFGDHHIYPKLTFHYLCSSTLLNIIVFDKRLKMRLYTKLMAQTLRPWLVKLIKALTGDSSAESTLRAAKVHLAKLKHPILLPQNNAFTPFHFF